ncbi:MAG: YesL family protein [Oscillospiraceae bacterium]|nr:YesL family protein [Oscillospiraceae bacterium]
MSRLFSPDGLLWKILNSLTDIFAFSLIWLFCCLPIVTIGPATTALYDAVTHGIRYQETGPYRRFFRTFKADLKISIPTSLFWTAIIALGFLSLSYLQALGETNRAAAIASSAYYIIMLLPIGCACWVFPILSRFTYGFKDLNMTALRLAIAYLPQTVVLVLSTIEMVQLCVNFIFPSFFLPACLMLLWSLFTEPVFTKLGGGLGKKDAPEETNEEKDE